jgi:enoyl-CoA hydratase
MLSSVPLPETPRVQDEPFTSIAVETTSEGVVIARLNRPDRLNAVDHVMHRELAKLFHLTELDQEARALLLTGNGRGFSVGGDLEMMDETMASTGDVIALLSDGRRVITSLLDCRKPIVAAVNGVAMGIGCQIALLSDITIAGRRAKFSDGHMIAGIAAGDGGALVWPLLVGLAQAKRYLLTGDTLDAERALEIGLIAEVVDDDALEDVALAWARRLAAAPAEAIGFTKLVLNQWLRLGALIGLDFGLTGESLNLLSPEARQKVAELRQASASRGSTRPSSS